MFLSASVVWTWKSGGGVVVVDVDPLLHASCLFVETFPGRAQCGHDGTSRLRFGGNDLRVRPLFPFVAVECVGCCGYFWNTGVVVVSSWESWLRPLAPFLYRLLLKE